MGAILDVESGTSVYIQWATGHTGWRLRAGVGEVHRQGVELEGS